MPKYSVGIKGSRETLWRIPATRKIDTLFQQRNVSVCAGDSAVTDCGSPL